MNTRINRIIEKSDIKRERNRENSAAILRELTDITQDKSKWAVSFNLVCDALDIPSENIRHKALFLLGEMGLSYPDNVDHDLIKKIASCRTDSSEKVRAQAVCAMGRIGRGDYHLIVSWLPSMLKMRNDQSENVRMNVIWACENIATQKPELFADQIDVFAEMLEDPADYVRMEAPEMFRVLGKRKPEYVLEYRSQLKELSEDDENRVVRVHADGALKAIETAADKKKTEAAQ